MDKLNDEIKRNIKIVEKTLDNIRKKVESGEVLRDQELRFLEHYPELIKKVREKVEQEPLPEGKLKEFVESYYLEKKVKDIEKKIKEGIALSNEENKFMNKIPDLMMAEEKVYTRRELKAVSNGIINTMRGRLIEALGCPIEESFINMLVKDLKEIG